MNVAKRSRSGTAVLAQDVRLRAAPSLELLAPGRLPRGTPIELLSHDPPGWVQLRARGDAGAHAAWCMRRMVDAALHAAMPDFPAASRRMWELAEHYTGRVRYERGTKAIGLGATPPAIDCSGWVALLLTAAMTAQNAEAGGDLFRSDDIAICNGWSDRILLEIEARTPVLLQGGDITADALPRTATIGLDLGYEEWTKNFPRLRAINHIAQVVRRPGDRAPFVSEAIGPENRGGVFLTPLGAWLERNRRCIEAGKAWAVDPFAMADPGSPWLERGRGG